MEITEVRIFNRESEDKKLRAFATITFDDCFVVRNIKIIEGSKGLFVAMPSRKLKESCKKCGFKNPARSKFCNQCAATMPVLPQPAPGDDRSQRQSEHRDIAHPITAECRELIQRKVLAAYDEEGDKASPGQPALDQPVQDQPAPDTVVGGEPLDATNMDID